MKVRHFFFAMLIMIALSFCIGCGDDDDDDDDSPGDDDDDNDDDNNDDDTAEEYDYDVPLKSTSPWPMFRRTSKNNGRSPVMPEPSDITPWAFPTEKGMFHAPAIDEDGTIYMGSADTNFYALSKTGQEKWRLETSELIDSSALIAADGTIFVPTGEGFLYALTPQGDVKWKTEPYALEGYLTWWEGHISMGYDGTLFAGNDDRRLYAIDQDGEILWAYKTFDQVWSTPSFGKDGQIFFGCNDFFLRSLNYDGTFRWATIALGPISSSPAVTDDQSMVVVGAFDGYLHAVDTDSGDHLWKFPMRDHIYSTPAIAEDGTIYVGSADGTLYAINPDGSLKWAFDTLDSIRSSPAIDGEGNIYFGCGDGRLYAIQEDGTRLWSFQTEEGDRNDLNGSPAIGRDGVVIGGEGGNINFIPFGYCDEYADSRCDTSAGEDIAENGALIYYYTSGGSSVSMVTTNPAPTEVFTFRLVVREDGDTIRARINPPDLSVAISPNFSHRIEVSANGNFFSVIPDEPVDLDQAYEFAISGNYLIDGQRIGNRVVGGEVGGSFSHNMSLTTATATGNQIPLAITTEAVSTVRLKRMAVPQPPMMTTFNQIGFDSYNFLMSAIKIDAPNNRFIMLAAEGTPGMDPVIYQETRSVFALQGTNIDSYFYLDSEGFNLDVNSVAITLDEFRLGGFLQPDLSADSLNVYAEVMCSNVEFFGFSLALLGLCNPQSGKMIVNGTGRMEAHTGTEGTRISGLTVDSIDYVPTGGNLGGGYLEAAISAGSMKADEHLPIIVIVDETDYSVKNVDYGVNFERLEDGSGNLTGARMHLPAGFDMTGLTAIVTVDLFPYDEETF